MTTTHRNLTLLLSLAGMTLALPGTADAQNALGGGDVLDGNLGVGTGGRNVRAVQEDYRSRNLLVTGNVAAGRGFRGTVGYAAENDFRGAAGSDSIYQFRAASALSAVNYLQFRDTFTSFELGQNLGVLEFQRETYGTSAGNLAENPYRLSAQLTDTRLRLDRVNQAASLSELRDSLAEPSIIGVAYDDEGEPLAINASSLRGVIVQPAKNAPQAIGLTTFDVVRLREDVMAQREIGGIGAPFQTDFTTFDYTPAAAKEPAQPALRPGADALIDTQVDTRMDPGEAEPRIDTRLVPEGYDDILKRVADRYAKLKETDEAALDARTPPKTALEQLDEDYRQLRQRLLGLPVTEEDTATAAAGTIPGSTGLPVDPLAGDDESDMTHSFDTLMNRAQENLDSIASDTLPEDATVEDLLENVGMKLPGRTGIDEEPGTGLPRTTLPDVAEALRPEATRPFDPMAVREEDGSAVMPGPIIEKPVLPRAEEFGVLLKHGGRIDTLTEGNDTRFNDLISSAEERLRTGEYFWAERRFSRALRFKPGHPLATAGMGHAQLGAGIYLSSALTLRTLLITRPEMIDTIYGEGLFPSRVRLMSAIDTLRERIARGSRDASAYAFLLAYTGHQFDDPALIREGLGLMKKASDEDKLVPLLEEIWLSTDEPPESK